MMNGEDATDQMIKESFFITHGNPILTVEDTHPLRPFFETWREKIFSKKPKAILIISGHWETVKPTVNAVHINDTIHDFDDYPAAMYQVFFFFFLFPPNSFLRIILCDFSCLFYEVFRKKPRYNRPIYHCAVSLSCFTGILSF